MPRRRQRGSSSLTVVEKMSSSKPSSKPSSTPASTPPAPASTPELTPPSPRLKNGNGLRRARANAAEQRRRSGLTIDQRLAQLCDRVLTLVKHFPLDGVHLVEVYEELADSTEYKLQPPTSIVLLVGVLLLGGASGCSVAQRGSSARVLRVSSGICRNV